MSRRFAPAWRFWLAAGAALAACAVTPTAALAHGGAGVTPHNAASAWSFDWTVIVPLIAAGAVYAMGVGTLWDHAGRGHGIRRWEASCFAAGLLAIFIALVSPLDAMSDVLFSAHMTQHMVLLLIAPPLLIFGRPGVAFAWAMPRRWSRALHRGTSGRMVRRAVAAVNHPAAVWSIFAAGFWAWHTPALFDAALRHAPVHALEHATFIGIGLQFWWLLIRRAGRPPFEYGFALVFVFTTMLQQSLLGALLTFSNVSWYGAYSDQPGWHISQIADQRLAGLIMWMPSNAIYLAVTAALLLRWLAAEEGETTESLRAPAAPVPQRALRDRAEEFAERTGPV